MLLKRHPDPRMDQVLPSQSSASGLLAQNGEEVKLRVDFFRKLGYSTVEVKAALTKLGLSTDTNAVLGELVSSRTSTVPSVSSSDSDMRKRGQKDPLCPPSWTPAPRITPKLEDEKNTDTELRPVVIDGSNVAMSHGNKEVFSCRGIQLAVNFFLDRGHNTITVFVPTWRKEQARPDAPITDQNILMELEKCKIVVFTPSRRVGGKRVVCYDDRFIVKLAYESGGVIVSNDTYRDLQGERPEWKKCIEERLLMYSFVNDKFMPPDDPLGRHGPSLDNFLRKNPLPTEQKRQLCPYDKKCTYGIKCKFYHPERANQSYLSLADELREKAQISSVEEERTPRLSPKQADSDTTAHNPTSQPKDSNTAFNRDWKTYSHSSHISENKAVSCENLRNSSNHMPYSGAEAQEDWPGLNSAPSHYYASISHEYQDSGLGSFESQYSDHSSCLSNSHRLISQQQGALVGARHTSCSCCSHAVSSTAPQQRHGNPDRMGQPNYAPQMFPSSIPHHHSLPGLVQYSGAPSYQQRYWSEPFQGLPQARTSCSFPSLVQSSPSHSSSCSYKSHGYQSWGQQQPPFAASDQQRLELRKKLHAIFNPQEVDTVMEMFPHLMDAEKLAGKILNMKTQRGIF
ncbi:endoribonuclease ZC3H12A [Echeneis naucrates]|uniref:Endoribonuclease ZC3H12A-like n=1 Tax=Echeneis naucrates TaxID=173247 RepID=A0A665SZ67_ECHNA|nr:endoribonuclease ZC3H12A-like [Echeneis naucrates]XP_029360401.1 endoribonuclease ZC3H12A-like [Echeneis naucrates]